MQLDAFLTKLHDTPDAVAFDDTMAAIEAAYEFTPTAFTNGNLRNEAGQNSGSCKLLAFASLHRLSQQQTLACFGAYYRDDVLQHPDGSSHQNIRNFMRSGWEGVHFDAMPLRPRQR
jgi:hypothetical protein